MFQKSTIFSVFPEEIISLQREKDQEHYYLLCLSLQNK